MIKGTRWCSPMVLLATLCADMPQMAGCMAYNKLCSNTSVVAQCGAFPAIPRCVSVCVRVCACLCLAALLWCAGCAVWWAQCDALPAFPRWGGRGP